MEKLINSGIVESVLFILLGAATFTIIFVKRDSYGAVKHKVLYWMCGIGCLNFFIIGAPLLFIVGDVWSKVYFFVSIPILIVCGIKVFTILYDGQTEERKLLEDLLKKKEGTWLSGTFLIYKKFNLINPWIDYFWF